MFIHLGTTENSVLTIKQLFSISNEHKRLYDTACLDAVKSMYIVRLTNNAWLTKREKMLKTCSTKKQAIYIAIGAVHIQRLSLEQNLCVLREAFLITSWRKEVMNL